MTKYKVKAVVSDYGIYEDNELMLVINSQANALLIKYVLEQDLKHKVVIKDLLKSKDKPKHKLRAITCDEFCHKYRFCGECPMYDKRIDDCSTPYFKGNDPFRTKNGKYILVEVKENEYTRNY